MSYIEFFGTIFTGWSVYLAAKNKVLNWPIGILGVILYALLFFQIRLYSDFLEQIYYFITGFWGWWLWTHPRTIANADQNQEQKVTYSSAQSNLFSLVVILIFSLLLGYFMSHIQAYIPALVPASFAYLDAATTIMSFVATIYLMKRRVENWYLWIIVDIVGVGLYYQKGVIFLSLLYFAFLINAFKGYFEWVKIYKNYEA